jgi:pSer/pThr/pTyr-binding forkhead associated (FHA) protein
VGGPNHGAGILVDAGTPGPVLAGTSRACQLVFTDRQVSRRHASFEVTRDGLTVRDLGSTNGTFAGGLRIVEAIALDGTELRLSGASGGAPGIRTMMA